jgi:hypothetical protein
VQTAMTRIDGTSDLLALIRRQLTAVRTQGLPQTSQPAAKAAAGKSATRSSANETAAIVAQRVRSIGADDPLRRRKAFRIFLESSLLNELGDSLINDPEFHRLVDRVEEQMAADPQLSEAMDAAAQTLLKA